MSAKYPNLNSTVTAFLTVVMFSLPLGPANAADMARLDELFAQLQEADARSAQTLAGEIELEFSKSGSATMDLLLKRGRDAFEAGKTMEAIEHLTALTDHAPDFAEGYYYRALAYIQAELMGPSFADLERVLTLNPRHFGAIEALGFLLEDMNRPEMAQEAYERVLALHPHHKDVTAALERLEPQLRGQDL
ncbi:tetratricopeptide repeat protein [Roseovarius sp. 2305UL8-3]|uniref:tetratricopeptide repeat protein n=1 Tax=Roseovarius conchicola TaxID=3121636 RepID=UPI0035295103